MGLGPTIAALAACGAVLGLAVAHDRRPYYPGKRNAIPLMILSLLAVLLLLRHLGALIR